MALKKSVVKIQAGFSGQLVAEAYNAAKGV